MNLISEWVMQIIVFILIGTILELLIPNNSMKKYVNIVIGLLLLLILAKPILYIFSIDVTKELEKMERTIYEDSNKLTETENVLEIQKREIQAEQDAYIWNEVKRQLIKEANPILTEQYSVQVADIRFTFYDEFVDKDDNLQEVIVILATDEKRTERSIVKPIIIETNEKSENNNQNKRLFEISNTLEQLWGLKKEQIQIMWEGGAS